MLPLLATVLPSQLSICAFLRSETLAQSLQQFLSSDRYVVTLRTSAAELQHYTEHPEQCFDCLLVQDDPALLKVVGQLYQQGMLFPCVILKADANNFFAYPASVAIDVVNFSQISDAIDQAIAQFINLTLAVTTESKNNNLLRLKQQQLTENFPDKSCYIVGVHKRKNKNFFQQLPPATQQVLLQEIKLNYRQIILNYFVEELPLKQQIDTFINIVFSSDIPVPQIIEIHMELIDEFSKQLKLEGRSDEVLLDYRLTLIDILAHLCEVYRSSIPKQF